MNTVAFVKTALIGTQDALWSLSIDVTLVRSSWQDAVDTITSSGHDKALEKDNNIGDNLKGPTNLSERVVICGAKGVGKSTCMKYTVNRLLSCNDKVAVIDCDVGQSEFTISGLVSLHIFDKPITLPSHLNLRKPELSYFVGDISTKSEPEMVMRSIELLNAHYIKVRDDHITEMQESANDIHISDSSNSNVFNVLVGTKKMKPKIIKMPLVINTDGWIKYMV